MATYTVSDLHGQYHIFQKLLEKIRFSEDDFMYVLGDAIDRGPDGIKLLQTIKDAPNMELIIGNHEFMMLNAVAPDGSTDNFPGKDAALWLFSNGGEITFEQYKGLPTEERQSLLEWLNSRVLTTLVEVSDKTFCLTHSYYNVGYIDVPFREIDYPVVWNIVWMTPYRPDIFVPVSNYTENDWQFIIGHVPVQRIAGIGSGFSAHHEKNITLIDGGCAYRGHSLLADNECGVICLKLDDMGETALTFAECE
ncbi:serine/threonine protein phosphatase 1 [Butyrivibrio sp. ob235]|uniref:metallophosphoesterase n=1 Tax=Butyrivibrio sp. ob235 TaxID=1761780 RepID=UPI0008C12992|nr:metallophosphoesterase [Butyrivibrio sp. ob235]SEL85312.1 serine/threonine protein phosphatase 1 [Butyrivibrio sp. ob235]